MCLAACLWGAACGPSVYGGPDLQAADSCLSSCSASSILNDGSTFIHTVRPDGRVAVLTGPLNISISCKIVLQNVSTAGEMCVTALLDTMTGEGGCVDVVVQEYTKPPPSSPPSPLQPNIPPHVQKSSDLWFVVAVGGAVVCVAVGAWFCVRGSQQNGWNTV